MMSPIHRVSLPSVLLLAAAAAAAQQGPPAPLPLGEVEFPAFEETTLANGARLLVVPNGEVPIVTVNLVLPGGSVVDPEGREGLAGMVAQLLTQGTASRSNDEIAEEMDFLGATLGAGAASDYLSVSLGALTGNLDAALDVMADVVTNPSFPEDRLELLRTQNLSALQVSLSQAATVAARSFASEVYGEHPYGRLETPETLGALTRDDLVAFHRTWFAPGSALFVVAGDVTSQEITAKLEAAFAEWTGTAPSVPPHPAAADRAGTEVILVHKPGSVQAEVRAGHLLEVGAHPDWTALSVGNQVLGGGSSGRLFKVLREERGYTYGAYSATSRRKGQGYFQASMAVRNEVVGAALSGLFEELARMRDQLVPSGELADTKDFMVGSFPLQIETPQQVASRVMNNRLLGLPEDAIETYRGRVAALDAEEVREVFRRHVDPGKMAVVVVGDANQIRSQLAPFGPIRMLDVSGNPLDAGALAPRGRSQDLSGMGLVDEALAYEVSFQGNRVGVTLRTLVVNEDATLTFSSVAELGPQTVRQGVRVRAADLGFVSSTMAISAQGESMGGEIVASGGRLVGTLSSPAGEMPVDMEAPPDVMVSDMLELAVWVADLEVGSRIEVPVANIQSGGIENVVLEVLEQTEVTVPAGTFDVFRVSVTGSESQMLWVRVEFPHIVVRLEPGSQPVVLELTSSGVGGG